MVGFHDPPRPFFIFILRRRRRRGRRRSGGFGAWGWVGEERGEGRGMDGVLKVNKMVMRRQMGAWRREMDGG